jgi:hypothetical protein
MTNLAHILLSLTLAAHPGTKGAKQGDSVNATEPAPDPEKKHEAAPAPAPDAEASAESSAPVAKPAENDIEVLKEVVDLQESEDPAAGWYGKAFPAPVRILALRTARPVRAGGYEFVIDHRAASPVYNSDSPHPGADMWNNFLGFNGSMQIGLGLRYGVVDDLDVGIYRSHISSVTTDTYEFDARYRFLTQESMGLDVAARAGVTWFSQPNAPDASGFYGQLLATRLLINRILVSGGVLYHSNSTNGDKYNQDKKYSVATALAVEARLAASVAFDAEVVSCNMGYCSKNPNFSAGFKYFTNRHTMALVVGNTQWISADGYVTNTPTPYSKIAIGFNLTREY